MSVSNDKPLFNRVAFIGIGLIGSSLARVIKQKKLAKTTIACDIEEDARAKALELGIVDEVTADYIEAVHDADLVMLCIPIGAYASISKVIAPHLQSGTIVSDVGSVKMAVVNNVLPNIPDGIHFIPSHPIAGTENSGPESGFAELFQDRWCIITPLAGTDEKAINRIEKLWESAGMKVQRMDPSYHDKVLAITSHLPHLIAYSIVGTASNLEEHLKQEVIEYSASGFRAFTRIASSDPVMWRDIFLNNREAVLEILQRFNEDLTALQRAIRWGDGKYLHDSFKRTREIRNAIIDAKQDKPEELKLTS